MPTTVLSGKPHPGTPLRIIQSQYGCFLGFLDTDGNLYSRESMYYTDALGAAGDLDLLQMQAVPFKALRIPPDIPKSTPSILALLTAGHPVRGETEADPDFRPPVVDEEVSDFGDVPAPIVAEPGVDAARALLTQQAEALGIDVGDDDTLEDLVEKIQEHAVTPPDDTEDDQLEVPPGD